MRYKKKSAVKKLKFLLFLAVTVFIFWAAVYTVNHRILPIVTAISGIEARNRVNSIILSSVNEIVGTGNITSNDFYAKSESDSGMINSLSVNTVLVNELCGNVAVSMSHELQKLQDNPIQIPVGTLSGVDIFANIGPDYTVLLRHMGTVDVDYETKFEAVGINQINFQVWLNVKTAVRIVNPLQSEEITVERKVSLVNTVFGGKVPDAYLGNWLPGSGVVK